MGVTPNTLTPSELADQLAAERRGHPFLVLRDGDGHQVLHEVQGERVAVGREPGSDLEIGWDGEASRLHALLEQVGGSWTVIDDHLSRNGTFVNGTRIRGRRRLNDRDVLRFGSTEVLYRNPAAQSDETPQVSGRAAVAGITPAQHRVLVALCRPLLDEKETVTTPPSNRQIAEELTISVDAIRAHLKALFRIFDMPDLPQNRKRAELARRALAAGVVVPRDVTR